MTDPVSPQPTERGIRVKGHRLVRVGFDRCDCGPGEPWYGWECSCGHEYDGSYGAQRDVDHQAHLRAERAQLRLAKWVADGTITPLEFHPDGSPRRYRNEDVVAAYAQFPRIA